MQYEKLFRTLNRARVKYLVAGGVAVNLHGIERMTRDIDIMVSFDAGNLKRFFSAIRRLGLRPKVPVRLEDFANAKLREQWRKEKNMLVFSLWDPREPFFLLDVMTEVKLDFDQAYLRRTRVRVGALVVPVLSRQDLIVSKEGTGRPQDRADVYHLKRIKERPAR